MQILRFLISKIKERPTKIYSLGIVLGGNYKLESSIILDEHFSYVELTLSWSNCHIIILY